MLTHAYLKCFISFKHSCKHSKSPKHTLHSFFLLFSVVILCACAGGNALTFEPECKGYGGESAGTNGEGICGEKKRRKVRFSRLHVQVSPRMLTDADRVVSKALEA